MAKAGKPKLRINDEAFMRMLREQYSDSLHAVGEDVAAEMRRELPDDVEVGVMSGVDRNGRPKTMITIMHPSGLARQAKDGALTRPLAKRGFDITRYPEAT